MKLILACDLVGGIGYKNKLPWASIQGDLFRFRQLTTGQTIVMGRNTWESLPVRPLPNRTNIVVTSTPINGVRCISNLNELESQNVWLIGGATLVKSSWDLIDTVYLTKTYVQYTCDTYIDLVKLQQDFSKISCEQYTDHEYQIWKRITCINI